MFCQLSNAECCFAVLAHLSGDSCTQMVNRHIWFLVTGEDSAGSQPFCFALFCPLCCDTMSHCVAQADLNPEYWDGWPVPPCSAVGSYASGENPWASIIMIIQKHFRW